MFGDGSKTLDWVANICAFMHVWSRGAIVVGVLGVGNGEGRSFEGCGIVDAMDEDKRVRDERSINSCFLFKTFLVACPSVAFYNCKTSSF